MQTIAWMRGQNRAAFVEFGVKFVTTWKEVNIHITLAHCAYSFSVTRGPDAASIPRCPHQRCHWPLKPAQGRWRSHIRSDHSSMLVCRKLRNALAIESRMTSKPRRLLILITLKPSYHGSRKRISNVAKTSMHVYPHFQSIKSDPIPGLQSSGITHRTPGSDE